MQRKRVSGEAVHHSKSRIMGKGLGHQSKLEPAIGLIKPKMCRWSSDMVYRGVPGLVTPFNTGYLNRPRHENIEQITRIRNPGVPALAGEYLPGQRPTARSAVVHYR